MKTLIKASRLPKEEGEKMTIKEEPMAFSMKVGDLMWVKTFRGEVKKVPVAIPDGEYAYNNGIVLFGYDGNHYLSPIYNVVEWLKRLDYKRGDYNVPLSNGEEPIIEGEVAYWRDLRAFARTSSNR